MIKKLLPFGTLLSFVVIVVLAVMTATPVTAAVDRVYLDPSTSSEEYCNTVEVEIRADATNFQSGQIELLYNPGCCEVTNFVRNPLFTGGTWDSSTAGREWITFNKGLPTLTGDYLIGTLTIHCLNVDECTTALDIDNDDSELFDDFGAVVTADWQNGEFSCEGAEVVPEEKVYLDPSTSSEEYCNTVEVEIRADATNFQSGQIELLYNPGCCEVTNFVRNPLFTGGTWDSSTAGREWITFNKGLPTLTGDYLIGTLTIHCLNVDECTTALDIDNDDSELFDDFGAVVTADWQNGEFSCEGAEVVPEEKVYLDPSTSSEEYCNTVEVEIRADATNFQSGQIELLYNPGCCEVTNFVRNPLFTGGTWDSSTAGREWITFNKGLPTLTGDYLIGTLTIHCLNVDECTTALDIDNDDSELFDDFGAVVTADWQNGQFSCEPPLNTYYHDDDNDGYGDPDDSIEAPTPPAGYVEDNTDCDDTDNTVYPGAPELCDGKDNDCDTVVPADEADADGDGFRICEGDCDDTDAAVNPGATEVCDDLIDNDCDGDVDCGDSDCLVDADGDGSNAEPCGDDCDDNDADVNPDMDEILCNGKDDDCDPATPDSPDGDGDGVGVCEDCDDGDATVWQELTGYADNDGDGYGAGTPQQFCTGGELPSGYVAVDGDCNDTDAAVNPDASEVCDDLIDNDCDGLTDCDDPDCMVDADGDGYYALPCGDDCNDTNAAVNPGADEVPDDGIDNNCNGVVDEDFCLELDAGWNFVSIPKMVDGPNDAETVFNLGSIETCEYYDACAGAWIQNVDDIHVDPTRGYLVSKTDPEMLCLTFSDSPLFPPAQPVCAGDFNMIGFPSMDGMSVNDFKTATGLEFSIIMQWDSGYYSTGYMTTGRGYLIWPTADGSMPGMI